MRDGSTITIAKMMCWSHEAYQDPTPEQSACLYGIRSALHLCDRQWPDENVGWALMLNACLAMVHEQIYFDSKLKKSRVPRTELDMVAFQQRIIAFGKSLVDASKLQRCVLLGMRVAVGWVLELPAQSQALERLMQGQKLVEAMAPQTSIYAGNFNTGEARSV